MSDVAWDARVRERYPLRQPVAPARRVGTAAQHGDAWAATFCSARAVRTSAIPRRHATSASPAPAARRSMASTAHTPSSARASTASRRIRRISRGARGARRDRARARRAAASARFRSPISTCCRANIPSARRRCEPGELITSIDIPALPSRKRSLYLKVRDRASFAFALASAAVALDLAERHDSRRTRRARRRRHEALALARGRARADRQAGARGDVRAQRPTRRFAARARTGTTRSRSSWRSERSCAR